MVTTFEHFTVELFLEIFSYFQIHEIFHSFFHLNSRFDVIMDNLIHIPVYLGFNGMSIAVSEFYYKYLSKQVYSYCVVLDKVVLTVPLPACCISTSDFLVLLDSDSTTGPKLESSDVDYILCIRCFLIYGSVLIDVPLVYLSLCEKV